LRLGIGSCAAFSSANALHHDHSFGIGDLIEVKVEWFRANNSRAGSASTARSATGWTDRQQHLRPHGTLLRIRRLRCKDAFPRNLERRQVPFRQLGGNAAAGQQSVKFRMRQIEVARNLFELGAIGPSQPVPMPQSRDDTPHPATKAAGTR
jgi:hypothetical protein